MTAILSLCKSVSRWIELVSRGKMDSESQGKGNGNTKGMTAAMARIAITSLGMSHHTIPPPCNNNNNEANQTRPTILNPQKEHERDSH